MSRINSAHEVDSDTSRPKYPGLLQEVFQWKPKPKGKKHKSQIDDTRTEISYSISTPGGEWEYETSTYVSKDLATPSCRSVESKRSKKRSKRLLKDPSGSVHSEAAISPPTIPGPSQKEDIVEPSYFVTLKCPLCYDPDCILNIASHCPLLRHKDPPCTIYMPSVTKCNQCTTVPPVLTDTKGDECVTVPDAPEETSCNKCATAADIPEDVKCDESIGLTEAAKHESDCCKFCNTNCPCEENKNTFLPVSGLVQRDENGVAVTLLKANGGPIENSYEWANRRRWDVPSYVTWEYKISEWITAPLREHEKAGEAGHRKKFHKSRNKRKSRAIDRALAATPETDPNSEEPKAEEDDLETKLILDGNGFKIFSKGNEKILINYDSKNCKYIGCSCLPTVDSTNCGCGDQQTAKEKTKHKKKCSKGPAKISLLKETTHGLEPVNQKELEEKYKKEKTKSCDSVGKYGDHEESNQKLNKVHSDKREVQPDNVGKAESDKREMIGKDIRNKSRAEFLEKSLKEMLGDDYKNNETEKPGSENQPDNFISIICPGFEQTGETYIGGNLGGCKCAQNCCYSTFY